MDRITLNLDLSKKYVVACSFGPDSMALLDAAIKSKLNIVVAHVNYRKRDVSQFEQDELTKYCNQREIKIHILDLIEQKPTGNFQDWAREKRYEFFKNVADEESADAVLVAHNEDDLIETYLMQKKRGNLVKNYGISREIVLSGVKIIRPLLGYTKQFLQDYDDFNHVPYSIDKSNLEDVYTRNKIRHEIVQKLTKEERVQLLEEITNFRNKEQTQKSVFKKEEFLSLSYQQFVFMLDEKMQKTNEHRDLSEKYFEEIKKAFKTKTNLRFEITNTVWLELDYGKVYLVNAAKLKSFKNKIEHQWKNEWIDVDFSNGAEDRGIKILPEQIIIKNCRKSDEYIIRNYKSKINRLFIDWKMPLFLREIWPGIYDEKGRLLYVPRYRENFKDEHFSKFKIDTKYFLEF